MYYRVIIPTNVTQYFIVDMRVRAPTLHLPILLQRLSLLVLYLILGHPGANFNGNE